MDILHLFTIFLDSLNGVKYFFSFIFHCRVSTALTYNEMIWFGVNKCLVSKTLPIIHCIAWRSSKHGVLINTSATGVVIFNPLAKTHTCCLPCTKRLEQALPFCSTVPPHPDALKTVFIFQLACRYQYPKISCNFDTAVISELFTIKSMIKSEG